MGLSSIYLQTLRLSGDLWDAVLVGFNRLEVIRDFTHFLGRQEHLFARVLGDLALTIDSFLDLSI